MKAHIGVDVDRGVNHSFETTTAGRHNGRVWDEMLHSEEASFWADKDYVGAEREAALRGVNSGVSCSKPRRTARCTRSRAGQPHDRQRARQGRAPPSG